MVSIGSRLMNKYMVASSGLAVLAVLASVDAEAGECSVASVKGHYTYAMQGIDAAGKPYGEIGQEHYDGAGKVVTKLIKAGSAKVDDDTGTYTVNEDCTGSITFASGASYAILVAPSGDSFVYTSSKEGHVLVGVETRVQMD